MHIKTDGLVLRQVDIKDADRLLTVLTADEGKLTLKAPGVKRKGSRIKAAAQILTFSEFTIFENNGWYTIDEAVTKEQFPELRADMELLSLASYFAELLESVTDEDWSNPEILSLALNALYALCKLKKPPELVKTAFELRLMCLSGFEPLLDGCAACGNENPDRFNINMGVLHCAPCKDGEGISMPLSQSVLDAMRHIIYCGGKKVFSFALDKPCCEMLSGITEAYVQAQLERGYSTLDFYKTMRTV